MARLIAGFDWDKGNRAKCGQHGVSIAEIESLFLGPIMVLPDEVHSAAESRFKAIGQIPDGRHVFLAFTIRNKQGKELVRPISARYMREKEVQRYRDQNPGL